ncbi:MAG: hypothetical protein JOZ14_11550 [Acidobacteria bacterium]|nr:hypothetical protein [Acidobacteriota bacterium]
MGVVEDALSGLHAIYATDLESTMKAVPSGPQRERNNIVSLMMRNDLDRASLTVGLVCSDQLRRELLEFGVFARDIAKKINEGQPHAFVVWGSEFVDKFKAIMETMRKAI